MTSRNQVTVVGVVENVHLKKETNAINVYKIRDLSNDEIVELVCLRYRSDEKNDYCRTHSSVAKGDKVEATGYLRRKLNGDKYISVTSFSKIRGYEVSIPSIPLSLFYDRFVYQGVSFNYDSVNLDRANSMTIKSKSGVEITISEQGFEHTSFFVKSNKHENISYDLVENIPYTEIANVIAGPFDDENDDNEFPIIPLKINSRDVIYQGVKFNYFTTEMDKANTLTIRLKKGPKIVLTRQGPVHVGVVVYKNEYETFEGDGYDIMLSADYDSIVATYV